jgi:NADH:ubiquinone oxidoreductase subunit K
VIALSDFLILGAALFCISMAGIFLNRKNVIILLMAIELMLLSVNMNFIAFSLHSHCRRGGVRDRPCNTRGTVPQPGHHQR